MKLLYLLFFAVIGHGSSLQSTFSDPRYTKLTELNVGKCPMTETQLISLINQKLGGIEIPNKNKNKPHVSCVNDMGPSLQLTIYKNDDDSASTKPNRQRIEMKVHDGSPTSYKATRDTNYVYTWWFKLGQGMVVGDSFFHIFQLKAVGNVPDMPVFTLSLSNEDGLHMRSNVKGTETLNPSTDFLNLLPLKSVVGTWIQATVEVNYSNTPSNGYVKVSLKSQDGRPLADKQKSFRTYLSGAQFVRPKWGLYRQINNAFRPSDTELFQNIQIWKRK